MFRVPNSGDGVRSSDYSSVIPLFGSVGPGAAVLDGEAVALRTDGRPQPFQVTASRFARRVDRDTWSCRAAQPGTA